MSLPQISLAGPPYGGFRFPVESRIAQRTFEKFHLDVGIGDICFEPFEKIEGKDWLDFCGIPATICLVISVEQQFAEKIHAYTLPREQGYNSRVKDLVDMALLIQSYKIDYERVAAALKQTFARRRTHKLPDTLNTPPWDWNNTFEVLAMQCDLERDIRVIFAGVCDFYENALLAKTS
ncbi:nucleotidyl transferase AbiEii/AbiGii toxin family protein [Simkania negevensis]|uniref:nucleotidyl transferase AbiEii/AbiGii toxin family protein n=1 Tax=Simkania negevensis TaxID=83561 RepID=UPI0009ACCCC1